MHLMKSAELAAGAVTTGSLFERNPTRRIGMKKSLFVRATSLARGTDARTAAGAHFPHLWLLLATGMVVSFIAATTVPGARASSTDDGKLVAALDTQYQAAVKINDAATMARILADDFVLVTGSGKTFNKADMLEDAKGAQSTYEHNDEAFQTVRVWGDTAVVTARLWEKGTTNGKPFDRKFWFSDTYVRTPAGWTYVFGQSSLVLPTSTQ
jgi:ketosteroid isomerase-like protein